MDRLLSCLLLEMDGLASKASIDGAIGRSSVMLVATAEKKELIDPALLRPGRLSIHIPLRLPDPTARTVSCEPWLPRQMWRHSLAREQEIFRRKLSTAEVSPKDLAWLVEATEGWTGADLDHLCREAALVALRRDIHAERVSMEHLQEALRLLAIRP